MRKLASEDKAKANKIANECGANIISDLRNLSSCELKLIYGKDEFFDGKESQNGKTSKIKNGSHFLAVTGLKNFACERAQSS